MVSYDGMPARTCAVDLDRVIVEQYEDKESRDSVKIDIVRQNADEDSMNCTTFALNNEDHTIANVLRYYIMRNPKVEYCGYSKPHPSENCVHIRIQTYGEITAVEALRKGLDDVVEASKHLYNLVEQEEQKGDYMEEEN